MQATEPAAFRKRTVKGNANGRKNCGDIQKALAAEKGRNCNPDRGRQAYGADTDLFGAAFRLHVSGGTGGIPT